MWRQIDERQCDEEDCEEACQEGPEAVIGKRGVLLAVRARRGDAAGFLFSQSG
jgi:hypothetical protein